MIPFQCRVCETLKSERIELFHLIGLGNREVCTGHLCKSCASSSFIHTPNFSKSFQHDVYLQMMNHQMLTTEGNEHQRYPANYFGSWIFHRASLTFCKFRFL